MEGYLGQIILFAGDFVINNWHACDGTILQVSEYQALYSLIGNTYGGNAYTTFALPKLSARIPIGIGKGPAIPTTYSQGDCSDSYTTTLSENNLPEHTHGFPVSRDEATESSPEGAMPAYLPTNGLFYSTIPESVSGTTYTLAADAVSSAGHGQAFSCIAPCTTLTYLICISGVYPSRA